MGKLDRIKYVMARAFNRRPSAFETVRYTKQRLLETALSW